jgi:putative addiction module component (TIGR02574 family)
VTTPIDIVEKLALSLSQEERAALAANLLGSLSPVLSDEDEGIAEALRRDAELDADPDKTSSVEHPDAQTQRRSR